MYYNFDPQVFWWFLNLFGGAALLALMALLFRMMRTVIRNQELADSNEAWSERQSINLSLDVGERIRRAEQHQIDTTKLRQAKAALDASIIRGIRLRIAWKRSAFPMSLGVLAAVTNLVLPLSLAFSSFGLILLAFAYICLIWGFIQYIRYKRLKHSLAASH